MPKRTPKTVQFGTLVHRITKATGKVVKHNEALYKEVAAEIASDLRHNINQQTKGKDWGEGKQKNTGRVTHGANPSSAWVHWTGQYISFIEYGTGIVGYQNPYPWSSQGSFPLSEDGLYSPRPYGHKTPRDRDVKDLASQYNIAGNDEYWWFHAPEVTQKTGRHWVFSHGLAPMAPFYLTMREERNLARTRFMKNLNKMLPNEIGKAVKGV